MSSFAALMAMSQAQTKAKEAAVQDAISQRETKKREEQEAADRRHKQELERQAKLRQVQAEQEKREQEKAKQRELTAKAKEVEAERKQKQQMEKILGKARHQAFEERENEGSERTGQSSTAGGKRKKGKDSDDEEGGNAGHFLTRAEKRALKMDPNARPAWAQQLVGHSDRGGGSGSRSPLPSDTGGRSPQKHKRSGNSHTPIPRTVDSPSSLAARGDQNLSVRDRLKADYLTPIRLGNAQRDKRTQADYFQEKRQRALAANGGAEGSSGSDTRPKTSASAPNAKSRLSFNPAHSKSTPTLGTGSPYDSPPPSRKRQRSESFSSSEYDSDVPRKRSKQSSATRSALSGHIWELVTGKSKSHYANDVYSDDDDDMEASAAEQAREEAKALKAAKREDQLALEEEMRHEEMKKKKKLIREKEGR